MIGKSIALRKSKIAFGLVDSIENLITCQLLKLKKLKSECELFINMLIIKLNTINLCSPEKVH